MFKNKVDHFETLGSSFNSIFIFQAWQKRFFVLRDTDPNDGVSRLEIYPEESDYLGSMLPCVSTPVATPTSPAKRKPAETVLDLKHVTKVDPYTKSRSHPHAIMILCQVCTPLILSCEDDMEIHAWTQTLKQLVAKRQLTYKFKDSQVSSKKDIKFKPTEPIKAKTAMTVRGLNAPGLSSSDSELRSEVKASKSLTGQNNVHNLSFNDSCDLEGKVKLLSFSFLIQRIW